jgi:hypothetical protein
MKNYSCSIVNVLRYFEQSVGQNGKLQPWKTAISSRPLLDGKERGFRHCSMLLKFQTGSFF